MMEVLEDEEIMRTFLYGVEGVDYTLDGDTVQIQPHFMKYIEWPGPYWFSRPELQFKTSLDAIITAQVDAFYPKNFLQEQYIVPQTLELPYDPLDLRAVAQKLSDGDSPYTEFRQQVFSKLSSLDLFFPTYDNMYKLASDTFADIQKMPDSSLVTQMLKSIKK